MKRKTQLTAGLLLMVTLLSFWFIMPSSAVSPDAKNEMPAVPNDVLDAISKTACFIRYKPQEKIAVGEGLTVVIGQHISLSSITVYASSSDVSGKTIDTFCQTNTDFLENSYLVFVYVNEDKIEIQKFSISYDREVPPECIRNFLESETDATSVNHKMRDFISCQVLGHFETAQENAMGRDSSVTSNVCNVRDTSYHVALYTIHGNSYPLMIYKKDITYQAFLVANNLTDGDLYVILAFVSITPGNSISSLTADEIASMNSAHFYNDTYKNVIAVKGARTVFTDEFPDSDYFITMSPNYSLNQANGETISVSLGVPLSVSVSFVIPNSSSRIEMTSLFQAEGECTFQIEAFKKNGMINPCISRSPFFYDAGVYMYSGSPILSTSVRTEVQYYLQPNGDNSATWVGSDSGVDLFYINLNHSFYQ